MPAQGQGRQLRCAGAALDKAQRVALPLCRRAAGGRRAAAAAEQRGQGAEPARAGHAAAGRRGGLLLCSRSPCRRAAMLSARAAWPRACGAELSVEPASHESAGSYVHWPARVLRAPDTVRMGPPSTSSRPTCTCRAGADGPVLQVGSRCPGSSWWLRGRRWVRSPPPWARCGACRQPSASCCTSTCRRACPMHASAAGRLAHQQLAEQPACLGPVCSSCPAQSASCCAGPGHLSC